MKRHLWIPVVLSVLLLIILAFAGCTRAKTPDVIPPIAEAAGVKPEARQALGRAPELQGGTTIVFQPQNSQVAVGATIVVEVRVENVQNLFGADIRVSFDPAKLEVVDANPGAARIQVEPGSFLDPGKGFIAQNEADNTAGRIGYAITLLAGEGTTPASGGGTLMRITFKGKANGASKLAFISASLFNQSGNQIPATTQDGNVTVGAQAQATATTAPGGPAQTGTSLVFQPQNSQVNVGATTVVEVRVENVQNLFGAEVRISFDATKLEVVDADASQTGVQIEPGPFPPGNKTIPPSGNVADNTNGTITYAFSLLATGGTPTPGSGSGTLMRITFRGKAAGTSPLTFTSTTLLDQNANPITTTTQDGSVAVGTQATPTPTRTPGPTATPGPSPTPRPTPVSGTCIYTVRAGDTLNLIARRFGTSVSAIALRNGIPNPNLIFPGQRLVIPNCKQPAPPPPPPPPGRCFLYIVKPGEWLGMIAFRYGTTALNLARINGIRNPNLIFPGQRLTVCRGTLDPQ